MANTSFFEQKTRLFDRWAPAYDCLLTTIFYQAIHRRLLSYVTLPDSAQVLDLGCGTGKLLHRLAEQYPHLQGLGLDLSPEMLYQARRQNQHHPRLLFCLGNAEALPGARSQFDAVFNTISFLHYPDPQRVFDEVARVLKAQGRFYLADYSSLWGSTRLGFTPGGLRFYSPAQREAFAHQSGLQCLGHHGVLGPVLLSIFQAP
jgi:ubiquinone/menaquinone biosynthesis C-methylase UbiE